MRIRGVIFIIICALFCEGCSEQVSRIVVHPAGRTRSAEEQTLQRVSGVCADIAMKHGLELTPYNANAPKAKEFAKPLPLHFPGGTRFTNPNVIVSPNATGPETFVTICDLNANERRNLASEVVGSLRQYFPANAIDVSEPTYTHF